MNPIHVVLLREGDLYVAQCLEYDIAAQGETLDQVRLNFERALVGQICVDVHHDIKPLSKTPKAPAKYWKLWENAERLGDERPIYVPPPSADEADIPPAYMLPNPTGVFRLHTGA